MNNADGVSLVIAMFDIGSADGKKFCYSCGVPTQMLHDAGTDAAIEKMIREFILREAEKKNDRELENIALSEMVDFVVFDCLNDLPLVISNNRHEKCRYIGDVGRYRANDQELPQTIHRLEDQKTEFDLLVGECACGYQFAVDATFIDQVGDFTFNCPACGNAIHTAEVFPE